MEIFLTGLIGSIILVLGAAWPEPKDPKHPVKSTKNWLFFVGNFIMLFYAILSYFNGGPIFFVILEILVAVSNIFMMLNTKDKIATPIIGLSCLSLIVWSLYLFEGYQIIFFVLGLGTVGLGYAYTQGNMKRELALTLGSIFICIYSYIEASWIFFWLNLFFAVFSGYYLLKAVNKRA